MIFWKLEPINGNSKKTGLIICIETLSAISCAYSFIFWQWITIGLKMYLSYWRGVLKISIHTIITTNTVRIRKRSEYTLLYGRKIFWLRFFSYVWWYEKMSSLLGATFCAYGQLSKRMPSSRLKPFSICSWSDCCGLNPKGMCSCTSGFLLQSGGLYTVGK